MLRVLGAVEIDGHGPLRSRAQRRILSALALDAGTTVTTDRLVEQVWGDDQPDNPTAALQSQVSRLRRLLPPEIVIEMAGPGYRLDVEPDELDVTAIGAGMRAATAAGADERLDRIDRALALWRGRPYVELEDDDRAQAEAARLEAIHQSLRELRAESLLAVGRVQEAIGDLESQRRTAPLRERTVELLMRAYTTVGRRNDALAEYQALRTAMIEELGLDPSEELRELELSILTETTTAPHPPEPERSEMRAAPVSLPASSFIGRGADLERVISDVDEHRIVTLVGPGGVGTTRLAMHAAKRMAGRFDDGAVVVELTSIRTPDQLADLLVSTLDLRAQPGLGPMEIAITALERRRLLLVLDNCEHVIEAAARFADAVAHRAPAVTILATSREPLNIDGERVVRLQPLDPATDAVALFLDRALSHAHIELGERCRAQVEQICVALDGLPLAIELAAARTASMSLEEIVAGLDERFVLFTRGRRTAHERHRSLRALVDWSVQSLDESLADVLTTTSVFSGPFSATAAAAVCAAPEPLVRNALAELADRSLLVEHRAPGQPTRFGFLETIRAYAAELLAASATADEVIERHSALVLRHVETTRALMPDQPDADAVNSMMAMLADVRAVHRRFADDGDADRSLRLVAALHFVALLRMHSEMFGWITEAADRFEDVDHRLVEDVLASASIGAWMVGDLERSSVYARRAERRAAESTSPGAGRGAAEATADVVQFRGDNAAALERFERAVVLAEEQHDAARLACDLADGAMVAAYLGETERARAAIAAAWGLIGDHGSVLMSAWVAYCEGEALAESDPERAVEALTSALEFAERCSLNFVTGVAGLTRTGLQVRFGSPLEAVPGLVDLIEHWRRAGARVQQEITLRTVVDLLVRVDRLADAAIVLGAVLSAGAAAEASGADAARLESAQRMVRAAFADADDRIREGTSMGVDAAAELSIDVLRQIVA